MQSSVAFPSGTKYGNGGGGGGSNLPGRNSMQQGGAGSNYPSPGQGSGSGGGSSAGDPEGGDGGPAALGAYPGGSGYQSLRVVEVVAVAVVVPVVLEPQVQPLQVA